MRAELYALEKNAQESSLASLSREETRRRLNSEASPHSNMLHPDVGRPASSTVRNAFLLSLSSLVHSLFLFLSHPKWTKTLCFSDHMGLCMDGRRSRGEGRRQKDGETEAEEKKINSRGSSFKFSLPDKN